MAEEASNAKAFPYAVGASKVLTSPLLTEGGDRWTHSDGKWRVERKQLLGAAAAVALVKASTIGAIYAEETPRLKLVECSATPLEGALMEVTTLWETQDDALTGSDGSSSEETPPVDVQESWELTWHDATKPLQQATAFSELMSGEDYNATSGHRTYIECVERIKESPAAKQKAYQWRDPTKSDLDESDPEKWVTFTGEVPEAVKKYFEKWWQGIDSYLDCYPIVTHTKVFLAAPTLPGGAGEIVSSISWSGAPAGYQWRYKPSLSCDLATGRWTLKEEWTGAVNWDKDLYTHQGAKA